MKLEDYGLVEAAEVLIDEQLGEDFIKDLLSWEGDEGEGCPTGWTAMSLAYARLAFARGYQLRLDESKSGITRTKRSFEHAIKKLGAKWK